jgi:hypothetical protein
MPLKRENGENVQMMPESLRLLDYQKIQESKQSEAGKRNGQDVQMMPDSVRLLDYLKIQKSKQLC